MDLLKVVMKFLDNLSVGKRLIIGFGVGIALSLAANLSNLAELRKANATLDTLYQDRVAPLNQLKIVSDGYAVFVVDASHKARNGNFSYGEAIKGIETARANIQKAWSAYVGTKMTPEEQKLIDEVEPLMKKGDESILKLKDILTRGNQKELASYTVRELYPVIDPITEKISLITELQLRVAGELKASATKEAQSAQTLALFLGGLQLVLMLGFGWVIARSIVGPLNQMQATAEKISTGDLSTDITYQSRSEIGALANSFRHMIEYLRENAGKVQELSRGNLLVEVNPRSSNDTLGTVLRETVGSLRALISDVARQAQTTNNIGQEIQYAAESTAESSNQISQTIDQVAQATSESALTTQKIAQGSEDLATLVQELGDNIGRLETVIEQVMESSDQQVLAVKTATKVATESGESFEETVRSLARIQEHVRVSSETVRELGQKQEQIGAIVSTIDEIAEQTNLLALNAAIEAARAGEHGRGFAVVADEVRRLAERAGQATKEIAGLIEGVRVGVNQAVQAMDTTSTEVEKGATSSLKIREGYGQILDSIEGVRTIAEDNSNAVSTMRQTSILVEKSIASVSDVAQSTAAAAEQLSAMTEEMAASAQEVSANVQEQDARVAEIKQISNQLHLTATNLTEQVSQFQFTEGQPELRVAA